MNTTQLLALVRLGVEMREAQTTYFRNRSDANLRAAKKLEARFDAESKGALQPAPVQIGLFEEDQ